MAILRGLPYLIRGRLPKGNLVTPSTLELAPYVCDTSPMTDSAIRVRDLTFRYAPELPDALVDVDLDVATGSRCLLVGANGAGKTTLLRILGGRHMVDHDTARVLGRAAFHDVSLAEDVATLGGIFPFDADLRVGRIVDGVRDADPALRDRLIDVLGVDMDWSMRRVSDGQRRRVQILLGLLRRPSVLLLDEVTTDLDVIARQDLLAYLKETTAGDGTTIVYATHIFDTLDDWATHLAYLVHGRIALMCPLDEIDDLTELKRQGSSAPLMRMVDRWLRRDR